MKVIMIFIGIIILIGAANLNLPLTSMTMILISLGVLFIIVGYIRHIQDKIDDLKGK